MNRAQRILHFVAEQRGPVGFPAICRNVEPGASGSLRGHVSAQLSQLVSAGKLARTGQPGAYEYTATEHALVDRRRVTTTGTPAGKPARKPKKAAPARLVATPATTRTAGTRPASQAFQIVRPADAAPRRAGERESVEAFLARGGRIQRLANGEVSRPLEHIGLHAAQKQRKARARRDAGETTTTRRPKKSAATAT